MSDLITDEIFVDAQQRIAASNMNGIIGRSRVQPDIIANKVASPTMNVADQMLVLKTDNTLARARFDTIVNSTSSALPLADATINGMLRQLSGLATDFVDGTNHCQPVANIIPTGTIWDYLGAIAPTGWILCQGQSVLRADYSALFAVIGTTYGAVDGTHFTIPDARGRGTIGAGTGTGLTNRVLGQQIGAETTVLSLANLPVHAHSITDQQHVHIATENPHTHTFTTISAGSGIAGGTTYGAVASNTGATAAGISVSLAYSNINSTNNAGSGTAFGIMPPSLVVNKMVKT